MLPTGCPSFTLRLAAGVLLACGPAMAQTSHSCGNGVTVRLSSAMPAQGGLLRVELRASAALAQVRFEWDGREIPNWADPQNPRTHYGLLGIDLERAPGKSSIPVPGKTPSAEPLHCQVEVIVRPGKFANGQFKVDSQFVELSPQDQERAEREGARVREIYARVTPERLWQGRFLLPIAGAQTAGNFGRRRVLNGKPRSPHAGADFGAKAGTPVRATQAGRVALAEELFLAGNAVIVDHGLGLYTFYAHMESLAVKAGDEVMAGATLGRVGATGRVTGPHLHWSLVLNGARVNPVQLTSLATREARPLPGVIRKE